MIEKKIDVKTPDGVADCELFLPSENGSWPGVIMYTDIGGLRPVFREMAKRLAGEGFVVLVPNPFYRVSRTPVYPDPFKFGEEKTTARMAEVRPSVTAAGALRDGPSFVDFLLSQKQVKGKIGRVGYAHGGRFSGQSGGVCVFPWQPARIGGAGFTAYTRAEDRG